MKPILSIIVPSYKTKNYLDYSLPTFIDIRLFGKLLVLLIDDGTPDDTFEKLQEWSNNYPEILKCFHKENGGHGSVINYGVHNLVETKYFCVVDGDDYVDTEALCELVDRLYDIDEDAVLINSSLSKKEGLIENNLVIEEKTLSLTNGDDIFRNVQSGIPNSVFKTDIWKQNSIYMTENAYYEDQQYIIFPFAYVKTARLLPINMYRYVIGDHVQSISPSQMTKNCSQYLKVIDGIIEFEKREDFVYKDYIGISQERIIHIVNSYISVNLHSNKSFISTYHNIKILLKRYKKHYFLSRLTAENNEVKKYGFIYIFFYRIRHHFLPSLLRKKIDSK